jgi:UDP-3-O-[3-hydroxymyristoyl] glucosamine N-acyltransferase
LEIVNQGDGPSITIYHNDLTNDIFKAENLNNKTFIIDKDGKVGINKVPVSELDVNGTAFISDQLEVNKDLFVNRNQIVEGSSLVYGDTYVKGNEIVNGSLTVMKEILGKSLNITESVFIDKNLTADLANLNNLQVKDNVEIGNDLIVDNLLKVNGSILAKDLVKTTTLETNSLNVLDNVTIDNRAYVSDTLTVQNKTITRDLLVENNLEVDKNLSIKENLTVEKDVLINNNLTIDNRFVGKEIETNELLV